MLQLSKEENIPDYQKNHQPLLHCAAIALTGDAFLIYTIVALLVILFQHLHIFPAKNGEVINVCIALSCGKQTFIFTRLQ